MPYHHRLKHDVPLSLLPDSRDLVGNLAEVPVAIHVTFGQNQAVRIEDYERHMK